MLFLLLLVPAALVVTVALARWGYAAGRARLRQTGGRIWLWNIATILGAIAVFWSAAESIPDVNWAVLSFTLAAAACAGAALRQSGERASKTRLVG
jgi:hypothetical protein